MAVKWSIDKETPLPHSEAIKYWTDRKLLTGMQYRSLQAATRIKAFSVAGITKVNMVQSVMQAIADALENGTTIQQFKQDIAVVLNKKGWTGPKSYRIENLFRTSIQTAYNVGHWKRYTDPDSQVQVLVYDSAGDGRVRPTHAAMDGKAYPLDDPIWDKWFPPNGYGCRCTTQGMSLLEAEARGIEVLNSRENPASHQTAVLPDGKVVQLIADPGWAYNPGKVMYGSHPGAPGESSYFGPPPTKNPKLPAFSDYPAAKMPDLFESTLSKEEIIQQMYELAGKGIVTSDGTIWAYSPPSGRAGEFSLIDHITDPSRLKYTALIPDVMAQPTEAFLQEMLAENGKVHLRKIFIKRYQSSKGKIRPVLVAADWENGAWQPISVHPLNGDKQAEKNRLGIVTR